MNGHAFDEEAPEEEVEGQSDHNHPGMLGMVLGTLFLRHEKGVTKLPYPFAFISGRSDETRTRDLRRDRPVSSLK